MESEETQTHSDFTADKDSEIAAGLFDRKSSWNDEEMGVQCGRSKGLVFSEDGLNPAPYRVIQHYYDKAFLSAGLKWRSTHILRHTFATDFLEKTGNKLALQGLLGHSSSRQTDHYAKITDSVIKQKFPVRFDVWREFLLVGDFSISGNKNPCHKLWRQNYGEKILLS